MGEPNFIVITGATSDTNDRAGLMGAMGDFAQECKDNGAMRITYGSVLSGKHPNALIFIQFFESLAGFENVMKAIPNSKPYESMIKDHATKPFVRNVMQSKAIPFEPTLSPMPNYLVLTRARPKTLNEAEVINLLSSTTSTFKDHGAQTLRFGHTVTGNDIGTYLLGVTYPSMAAIEATYTELATNQAFAKLSAGIYIDIRSIVKIAGIL